MGITYVGGASAQKSTTSGTTLGITYSSTGGQLFCSIAIAGNTTVSSVTDSASNVWHRLGAVNNGTTLRVEVWKTDNVTPANVTSVTVTFASTGSRAAAEVEEYSGVAFVGDGTTSTGSTSPITTTAQTVAETADFLFMGGGIAVNSSLTQQNGTIRHQNGTTGVRGITIDNTSNTTLTDSATMTTTTWALVWVNVRALTVMADKLVQDDSIFGLGLGFPNTEQMVMSDNIQVSVPLSEVFSDSINNWQDKLILEYDLSFSEQMPAMDDTGTDFVITPILSLNIWVGGSPTTSSTVTINTIGGSTGNVSMVLVVVGCTSSTTSVQSITDTSSNIYSFVAAVNTPAGKRVEIWASQLDPIPLASGGHIVVTANQNDAMAVVVSAYQGVASLGATTTATGTASPLSISENITSGNNFIMAGFVAGGGQTVVATNGTVEGQTTNGPGSVHSVLMDNTALNPSSVTCSATTTTTDWAGVALELQAPSNPNLTLQFSDSMLMLDPQTIKSLDIGLGFPNTEQMVMSDAAIVTLGMNELISDTMSMSDSFADTLGFILTFIDLLPWRSLIATFDNLNTVISFEIKEAEQMTMSELLLLGYGEAITDQMIMLDAVSEVLISPQLQENLSDTMSMSDGLAIGYGNVISEQFSLTDSTLVGYGLIISEQVTITDVVQTGYGLMISEQETMSDVFVIQETLLLSFTETITFADSQLLGYGLQITDSDNFWNDSFSFSTGQPDLHLGVTDQLVMADNIGVGYGLVISDQVTFSDVVLSGFGLVITDQFTITDHATVVLGDILSLSDSFPAFLDIVRIGFGLIVSDQLNLTDVIATTYGLIISDSLNFWQDAFVYSGVGTPILLSLADQMTMSDAEILVLTFQSSQSDTMTMSDLLLPSMSFEVKTADQINTWLDAASLLFEFRVAIGENLSLWNDLIQLLQAMNLAVQDSDSNWTEQLTGDLSYLLSLSDDGSANWKDFIFAGSQFIIPLVLADDDGANWLDAIVTGLSSGIGPVLVQTINVLVEVTVDTITVTPEVFVTEINVNPEVTVDTIKVTPQVTVTEIKVDDQVSVDSIEVIE